MNDCPSPRSLVRFADTKGNDELDVTIAAHLEQCGVCRCQLDELLQLGATSAQGSPSTTESLSSTDETLLARIRARLEGAAQASQASETLPVLPGFTIEGLLGSGGQATVFRARQHRLGNRVVAVKMLGFEARLLLREHLARICTEAEACARLEHPNIVRIYEIAEHDRVPYLVLEYVDGGTLKDRLHDSPLDVKEAARLSLTLALALACAHQRGVVHRDLKPRNVLLATDGTPKISDFGLARLLDGPSNASRTDAPLGTREYMSPEQARGNSRSAGPETDVYSLGVILYELLTARPPFVSEGDDWLAFTHRVCHDPPVAPRILRPSVPRDLETICLKCLEKSPERRYPCAQALADDLRNFLNGFPITARPISSVERLWRWTSRNRWRAIAFGVGLAALLLVIGGVAYAFSERWRVAAEVQRLRADNYAALAEVHVESGDVRAAIPLYREALTLGHPGRARLSLAYAQALRGMGNYQEARTVLEMATVACEREGWGELRRLRLADVDLYRLVSSARAMNEIRSAVKTKKLSPSEQEYGLALLATDIHAVQGHLERALQLDPQHREANYLLAWCQLLLGRRTIAEQCLRTAQLKANDDPQTLCLEAVLQNPQSGFLAELEPGLADRMVALGSPENLHEVIGLATGLGQLGNVLEKAEFSSEDAAKREALKQVADFVRLAEQFDRKLASSSSDGGYPLPPALRRHLLNIVMAVAASRRLVEASLNAEQRVAALARLEAAATETQEGSVLLFHALALQSQNATGVIDAFDRGVRSPFAIALRQHALYFAIYQQWLVAERRPNERDAEVRRRVAEYAEWYLREPSPGCLFDANVVMYLDRLKMREFSERLLRRIPVDQIPPDARIFDELNVRVETLTLLADAQLQRGEHRAAVETAKRVLQEQPGHTTATAVLRHAIEAVDRDHQWVDELRPTLEQLGVPTAP